MRHIARASWHIAVLQARQELQGYCKRVMNSLKTVLQAVLANHGVFHWHLTSLAPLTHPEKWMHLREMCEPLAITFFSRQKSGVPVCDFGSTGGWSAGSPEWCCWAQQHCRTHSAVRAPVQRPRGWGSHPYPQLEALAQPVPNGRLEQHTQPWQGANSWHWRNETDSSWVNSERCSGKNPFKQRKEAESLELLSYFLLLQMLLAASFTGRAVQSGWAQSVPWQGPKHTGLMFRPGTSLCLQTTQRPPRSFCLHNGHRHLFPLAFVFGPCFWKVF